jgi:hypothetical protein
VRGCLTLIVGLVIGAAAASFLWSQSSAPVAKGIVAPQRSDVHAVLSDAYLSRLVNRAARGSGVASLHNIRLSSNPPGALVAQADGTIGPLTVPVSADVAPSAQNGSVQITLLSTHVGSVPIPTAFTGLIEAQVNQAVRSALGGSVRVVAVDVVPQGLEVYANYR